MSAGWWTPRDPQVVRAACSRQQQPRSENMCIHTTTLRHHRAWMPFSRDLPEAQWTPDYSADIL